MAEKSRTVAVMAGFFEGSIPARRRSPSERLPAAASHLVLFAAEPPRCDACGGRLPEKSDDHNESAFGPGEGLYLWARGGEVQLEKPELCSDCALAIGLRALTRFDVEENDG